MIASPPSASATINPVLNSRSGYQGAGPAALSALAALVVYVVTLHGTYVYDDIAVIQLDPRISHVDQWKKFWTQAYFANAIDNLYRPLVSMSYAVEWHLHGDRPRVFHAVNWLLHAAAAAVFAEFLRRAAGLIAGYLGGIAFAVHPVHVEAVANIVGRAELMCTGSILAALLIFQHRPFLPRRAVGIFLLLIVAVLSKEQGLLLPPILLLYGLLLWNRPVTERSTVRWFIIAVSWCMAGYMIFREHLLRFEWDRSFLDWGMQPMIRCVGADRWLMPIVLLGHYLQLLIFPVKLSVDYGAAVIGSKVNLSDPYLWLGVAAMVAWIAGMGIAIFYRARFSIFCLLSLALSYGLVANLLALMATNMAERLMYLPSVFFLALLANLIAQFIPRISAPARTTVWIILSALFVAASIRTVTYAARWNNRLKFYVTTLAEQPRSTQAYLMLAAEYIQQNDYPDADAVLQRGNAIFPDYWKIWMLRGLSAMQQGHFNDADHFIDRAFHLSPNGDVIGAAQRLQDLKATTQRSVTH